MPSRTYTSTQSSVNYFENQTMRGLIYMIEETGLSCEYLLDVKEGLIEGLNYYLERQTLKEIELVFCDRLGFPINNGFGRWIFKASYNSSGRGVIEFPVREVCDQIQRNKWAFATATSYKFYVFSKSDTSLPPGWSKATDYGNSSGTDTYVASYGWSPLICSIYRK